MKQWRPYWLGLLASSGLATAAWAQIPGGAAVPGAAAGAAAPAAAAPAAAPASSSSLWSFLCPDPTKVAACKAKFCASPLGQLLTNMMAPAAAMTGGILGNCCPPNAPTAAGLAAPSDTPDGAAAKIKADEAGAKKRREAVRYLGTVDCHYWPEAQKALINALRADRNECVRLEAAWALGRGCCCTKYTIVALSITVAGSDRDGNPSENCERVKVAAAASLSHCLACLADSVPLSLEPPSTQKKEIREGGPVERLPPTLTPMSYYEQVEKLPMKDIAAVARRVLAKANVPAKATPTTDVAHSGAFNIIAGAIAAKGPGTGNPGNAGNMDVASNAGSPPVLTAQPASLGYGEVVSADPPRTGGILAIIARHLAPTPLSEGQTEDSAFKNPPIFQRKVQPEQVVITGPMEQPAVNSLGQPMAASVTMPAPLPIVTTEFAPAKAWPNLPAPVLPPVTPAAAKQTNPQLVQTSYLAVSNPSRLPTPPAPPQTVSIPVPAPGDFPKYVRDLILTVKTGKSCEEGLAAVFSLANSDWRTHPEVVLTLATAARNNPMLPVRITAIRCLVGIRVNNETVRGTLQMLKSDADPTVRTEAERALNSLVFYTPSRDSSVMR